MNDKIKAQWMAQYLGQKILTGPNVIGGIAELRWEHLNFKYDHELPLLLRTVDMLTDDEMSVVCQLDYAKFWTDIYKQKLTERAELLIGNRCFNPAMSGYLRSIGILLPFTYLNESNQPVTLTPDELVKLGWAKIKTS